MKERKQSAKLNLIFCLFFFSALIGLSSLELVYQTFARTATPTLVPPYEGAYWTASVDDSTWRADTAFSWSQTSTSQGEFIATTSTTFTVPAGITEVEVLVVAGGGGGSSVRGAGGAGGLVWRSTSNPDTDSNTNYAVTPGEEISIVIGDGGTAATSNSVEAQRKGGKGQNSSFGTLTAEGGGGGGADLSTRAGGDGGSGGGGDTGTSGGSGNAGPPRQGYDGGAGDGAGTPDLGGGGGGAGAAGGDGSGSQAGNGGIGREIWGAYYAGGGGAGLAGTGTVGSGGNGGGGNGGDNTSTVPQSGTANTGGGGGGGSGTTVGGIIAGAGGSGIVIVRWGGYTGS